MWNKVYPNVKLSLLDNQMLAFFHHWVNLEHLQIKVIIFKMGKGESKVKRTKIQNHKLKNNLKMKSNCIFLDRQKHQTEDRAKCVCDHVIASSVLHQCCLAGRWEGIFPWEGIWFHGWRQCWLLGFTLYFYWAGTEGFWKSF